MLLLNNKNGEWELVISAVNLISDSKGASKQKLLRKNFLSPWKKAKGTYLHIFCSCFIWFFIKPTFSWLCLINFHLLIFLSLYWIIKHDGRIKKIIYIPKNPFSCVCWCMHTCVCLCVESLEISVYQKKKKKTYIRYSMIAELNIDWDAFSLCGFCFNFLFFSSLTAFLLNNFVISETFRIHETTGNAK